MLKITGNEDFSPTPASLLDKITAGLEWPKVKCVLEPSAGRGAFNADVDKVKTAGRGFKSPCPEFVCSQAVNVL